MEVFEVNDVSYACRIHQHEDELPGLLMLHGFMGDHRVFDHLIDELCRFCNPVTVDLLGFGSSSKPSDPDRYNEEHQIADLFGFMEQLDSGKLYLFGYSMGGRLALKTALADPGKFDGLLLESATCGITDESDRQRRRTADAARAERIREDFPAFLSEWQKLELFQSPEPADKTLAQKYRQIQSGQSPEALANSLLGFGTGAMTPACDELKRLNLPVLLLAGSADKKYRQINRYLVNQFPNATFSSIKAGHRTHLDNPSAFVHSIEEYIKNMYPN